VTTSSTSIIARNGIFSSSCAGEVSTNVYFFPTLSLACARCKQDPKDPNDESIVGYAFDVELGLDSCQGTTLTRCKYTEGTSMTALQLYVCAHTYVYMYVLVELFALVRFLPQIPSGSFYDESLEKIAFLPLS